MQAAGERRRECGSRDWELVERRSAATPDRVMLYDGDRSTTFAQYLALCERAAAGLYALGVTAGTNVSWQLPTWTESAVLVGALCRLGARVGPTLRRRLGDFFDA